MGWKGGLFKVVREKGESIVKRAAEDFPKLGSRRMFTHTPGINWKTYMYEGAGDIRVPVTKHRYKIHSTVIPSSTGEVLTLPYKRVSPRARYIGGRGYKPKPRVDYSKKGYIPPPRVKQKSVLTKQQFMRLLERDAVRQRGRSVVGSKQPMEEVPYTRLMELSNEAETGLRYVPRDVPYGQGKWMAAQSRLGMMDKTLTPGTTMPPPADVLSYAGGQPSYQRRVFRPLGQTPERVGAAVESMQQPDVTQAVQQKLSGRATGAIEALQGPTAGKATGAIEATPAEKLVKDALILDSMWKDMGGGNSIDGRRWKILGQSARGRRKVKDAREHFMRVGLRWMQDPEGTAKIYPREVRMLEEEWEVMKGGLT